MELESALGRLTISTRVLLLAILAIAFLSIEALGSTTLETAPGQGALQNDKTDDQYKVAVLARENGDEIIKRSRYTNTRYGIDITFPDGWHIATSTVGTTLIDAEDDSGTVVAHLSAARYIDIDPESPDAYNRTFWRMEKYHEKDFADNSEGMIYAHVSESLLTNIGTTSRGEYDVFWPLADGAAARRADVYNFFGHNGYYFILQFDATNEVTTVESLGAIADSVMDSVTVNN